MILRQIFINDVGRLRSGWRLLLFVAAFMLFTLTFGTVLGVALALLHAIAPPIPHATFIADVIYRLILLASALLAGYLCARRLEGLPFRSLGLTFHPGWFRDLIIGSAIGFAALVVAVAIAMTGGGLHFAVTSGNMMSAVARSLVASVVLLIWAALAEEAMFRGYGLQTLARARLAWLGVLLTCVFFGVVHLKNPNVVPGFTLANTALAGVWLGVAYLRTRSLWFPLGVHWSWNWALGWFFGLPVSGIHLVSNPLLKATDTGPFWLTGGSYGIEGGVASTIALVLFTIFISRTSLVSATPELLKMTSQENPKEAAARAQF
jgi:membrane protease YdiL (CAAX protease family)